MKSNRSNSGCEGTRPSLPGGRPVGELKREHGVLVWERRVRSKHVLRMTDSWTVNHGILRQLADFGVTLLRYIAPEGTYEVALDDFVRSSSVLRKFARGEDVHALPRSNWAYMPRLGQLDLFGFEGRA